MMSKFIIVLNLVVISLVIGVAVNCLYQGLFNYSIITTNRLGVRIIKTNGVDDDADIIHRYQEEDVVTCLNQLSLINKARYNNETVQIAFVGDSTIRNVFQSFIRVFYYILPNSLQVFFNVYIIYNLSVFFVASLIWAS